MLKKFIIHILLIVCLCISLSNCKHEPDPNGAQCGDAQTIDEMKQWVLFKPGTYWIYEEETSGERDTVTVTEYFDGLSAGGFAAFGCVMHSSFDGYDYDYWFNDSYSGISSQDNCFARRIECSKSKPGDHFGNAYVYSFPLKLDRQAGINATTDLFGYLTIIDYPFVWSSSFDTLVSCVKFNTPYAVQHNWTEANYILSKNFGIVQKELVELEQNWFLIEAQIIQ